MMGGRVFDATDHTVRLGVATATLFLSALLSRHARDSRALVLRFRWAHRIEDDAGRWAGKIGSHEAHHRFRTIGRQPHLQVNLWRIGVKGSGVSYRVPLLSPAAAYLLIAQPFG